MGWAEYISTAFQARSWLVLFKHHKQIGSSADHTASSRFFAMDFDMAPYMYHKSINTLGQLLGNATFVADVRFAPNCRAYVFEDEQQRPVAAIWSYIAKVDAGREACPSAKIKFTSETPELFDLMQAKQQMVVDANGSYVLAIPSAPIFLRGTRDY